MSTLSAVRNRVARKPNVRREKLNVPFSFSGIVAVLCCPAILSLEIFAESKIVTGVLYVLVLTLLANQRSILILMYASVSSVMMMICMRVYIGHPGMDLMMVDKAVALIATWVIAFGLVRNRRRESNSTETIIQYVNRMRRKPKPLCVIRTINESPERIADVQEAKLAFSRIDRSGVKMDEYTRDLTWFIYQKSLKN